ncbi:jg19410 [Pararge aegeria aegeria]|uniref:Jg19410 protein n=1 Tax=Pararge aegeria aegeria TaxID=348720 RepID=A0A8S4R768_9NEOP|nr:jg19410 [Pararge aegeria aegeria]
MWESNPLPWTQKAGSLPTPVGPVLEPIGLARSDGKRPDGMTLIPWRLGRSLLWDATCVDTLAASHIQATSSLVGAAASSAEQAKRRKYENLDSSFIFVPFGVETLGPWGSEARALLKELSKRVIEPSGDPRAGSYLGQRISLAIQRGIAASILGTVPRCGGFEDVLDFISF